MIAPIPHFSPWRPFPGASRSSAWENLCSPPLPGRDDPAMLIATPEDTSAFVTSQAPSSEWGLMRSAFLKSISAVIRERVSAYSESGSHRRRWESSQSRIAV